MLERHVIKYKKSMTREKPDCNKAQLQMVPHVDWSPLVYGTHRELIGSSSMGTECLLSNRNFSGVYLWNKHKRTPGIV